MRTEIKTFEIYTFAELSEESKEKAIDSFRYHDRDFDNDYIIEDFINEVKEKTGIILNSKDINWSVGDRDSHFSIKENSLQIAFLNDYSDDLWDIEVKAGVGLNHLGGGICRQVSTQRDCCTLYFEEDISEEQQQKTTTEINEKVNIIIDLCEAYHKRNEEAYNYIFSDECIREEIELNDYEFNEDGSMY